MKIALVHDPCNVGKYLRDAFLEMGYDVISVACNGGQREDCNVNFGMGGSGLLTKVTRCIKPFFQLRELKKVDVVQLLYFTSIILSRPVRFYDLHILRTFGCKLGYYGLGCDEVSLLRANTQMYGNSERWPCKACMAEDDIGKECYEEIYLMRNKARKHSKLYDYCASASVEYKHCHEFFPNAKHAKIPLPVNIEKIGFYPARNNRKTKVVHAPTRRGFKGTKIIIDAINALKKERTDFDFKIVENLSYNDYFREISGCDVLIDQVLSHGVGMAALEGLAMGKIVLSGNSEFYRSYFPFASKSPVIHAPNAPHELKEVISRTLDMGGEYEARAERGRSYVEEHHGHLNIANQFINLWNS